MSERRMDGKTDWSGVELGLGEDAISRQAESLAERLEGQVSSTRYRKIQDSSVLAQV